MPEIQDSVSRSIDHIIENYFECITGEPEDGDLVIYQTTKEGAAPLVLDRKLNSILKNDREAQLHYIV